MPNTRIGPPVGFTACRFRDGARTRGNAVAAFLRAYADDIPKREIRKATTPKALRDWTVWCPRGAPDRIAAVMRDVKNDWYLCTVKNAAVRPDMRGRGIGGALYRTTVHHALHRRGGKCLVLAADVTVTNVPSIRALTSAGFRPVSRFCWRRGQKPADVMHFVRFPPHGGQCRRP